MLRSAVVALALSGLIGCTQPTAIRDFAALSTQVSTLFPSVAATAYESCVERERYRELDTAAFDPKFRFDNNAIERSCGERKKTMNRMIEEYKVLGDYMTTLGSLSSSGVAAFDKSLTGASQSVAALGAGASEQAAVTGLVSIIADAFLKSWKERELRHAIELAQPHVHLLCTQFERDLGGLLELSLDLQTNSLAAAYLKARDESPHTLPFLLAKGFQADLASIEKKRAAVVAMAAVFSNIDKGHRALYDHRNRLSDKATLADLFQNGLAIQKDIADLRKAIQ